MSNFDSFKTSFTGDIYTPNDADYDTSIIRWAVNAQRNAQVVTFPKGPEDVVLAIAYARENKMPIGIRGGGHSTSGASSSEGLVIDLSRHMKSVEVDKEKHLAYVGGGATWADVDKATILHGLAGVAGTVNHTGVGGLALGGGIGWQSGAHGLVVDNIVQATIVNSSGEILTASEGENRELLWGIRGGGCNFGVATQFVFKVYPQRRTVYAGKVIYPAESLEKLMEVNEAWWQNATEKEATSHFLVRSPHGPPVAIIAVIFFYNGTEAEGRENFKAFFDIKHVVDTTKEIPYEELNGISNPMVEYGKCRLIKGAFQMKADVPSLRQIVDRLGELGSQGAEHSPMINIEYFPLGRILGAPKDSCAFVRSGACNVNTCTTWQNNTEENLEKARALAHELTGIIASGQKAHFTVNRGYGNYDQDGSDDMDPALFASKAQVLFGENYPRMQKLKKEHDPENIFSKWFPITPAA